MKKSLTLALCALWALPVLSANIHIELMPKKTGNPYNPYYAMYLTDDKGKYIKTLHVIGNNPRFQQYMQAWYRNAGRSGENIDALSGATLLKKNTFSQTFEIDDMHLTKGHQLVFDSANPLLGAKRKEIVIKLSMLDPSQKVMGNTHIDHVTATLK